MAGKKQEIWGNIHTSFPGRLNFAHIARPGAAPKKDGGKPNEPRYSATLIQKVNDHTQALINEIEGMGLKRFGEKWNTSELAHRPYCSGADVLKRYDSKLKEAGEGKLVSDSMVQLYTNKVQIQANSSPDKEPPACYVAQVGAKPIRLPRRPGNEADIISIENQFYNGAYCTLAVKPFTYKQSDAVWGVTLLLCGIKFVKDGDKLGAVDLDAAFAHEEEMPDDAFMDETDSALADDETAENI